MPKRLAMNTEGKLTYCTASEENVGKGRCNHIAHQRPGETSEEFCERATEELKIHTEMKLCEENPDFLDLQYKKLIFTDPDPGFDYEGNIFLNPEDGKLYYVDSIISSSLERYGFMSDEYDDEYEDEDEYEYDDEYEDEDEEDEKDYEDNTENPSLSNEDIESTLQNGSKILTFTADPLAEYDHMLGPQTYDVVAIPLSKVQDKIKTGIFFHTYDLDDVDINGSNSEEDIKTLLKLEKELGIEVKPSVDEEIENLTNYNEPEVRAAVAKWNHNLDILINDEDWQVRKVVAGQGYGLDRLIDDESFYVRGAVAKQGYGLDRLINDKSYWVRQEVAEQGYGLDKLVDDSDSSVRFSVARRGYGLDKLVNDPDEDVRIEVARQGYRLDKLINDKEERVRQYAERYFDEHHLTIEQYNQKVKETGGYDWVKEFNHSDS